jgi:hypothetical protein
MHPMTKSIPPSVLNLLAEDRDYTPGCLPRYVHRPEDRGHRNGLTWSETKALIEDGVVSNDWIGPGLAVAVEGDDHRAICVFRDEVYEAWERLKARTNMAGTTTEMRRVG